MSLPGVKVGPLDPEATAEFGHVAANRSARRLVRLHNAMYSPELRVALAKPLNAPRTKALRLDEVRDAVEVPDGHIIVGASIRGAEDDPNKVLTYTYSSSDPQKARSVKWFVALADVEDDLPSSSELGDRLAVVAENKELGLFGGEGQDIVSGEAHRRSLERQLSEANKRADELSRALQERDQARAPAEAGGVEAPSDEPVPGFDELNATDAAALAKESDQDTRDAIAEYEAGHKNRKTVMAAAESTAAPEE